MHTGSGFRCSQPAYYRIYVQGPLDARWLGDYIDMRVERIVDVGDAVVTKLTGELVDQSALIGVLSFMSDLGAPPAGSRMLPLQHRLNTSGLHSHYTYNTPHNKD